MRVYENWRCDAEHLHVYFSPSRDSSLYDLCVTLFQPATMPPEQLTSSVVKNGETQNDNIEKYSDDEVQMDTVRSAATWLVHR